MPQQSLIRDIIPEYLKENRGKKFTARELAEWLFKNHRDQCNRKREKASKIGFSYSDSEFIQQIIAEIGAARRPVQKKHPQIRDTEDRPRLYYYASQTEEEENEGLATRSGETEQSLSEHDLYPLLAKYLSTERGIYSKRIDEKTSSSKYGQGGNKWLHPDMVAMEDLSSEWNEEIKKCAKEYSDKRTQLWSFEVKKRVNNGNVREAFFQTVSNSSWANLSYLVASQIEGKDILKELEMLNALHGVGVIRLDAANPSESQIIFQAKERIDIDWRAASRLAETNKDFKRYVQSIREFYQTGNTKPADWEKIEKSNL